MRRRHAIIVLALVLLFTGAAVVKFLRDGGSEPPRGTDGTPVRGPASRPSQPSSGERHAGTPAYPTPGGGPRTEVPPEPSRRPEGGGEAPPPAHPGVEPTSPERPVGGTVRGRVTDRFGRPRAATVALIDATSDPRRASTDGEGGFAFPGVLPGSYAVHASGSGSGTPPAQGGAQVRIPCDGAEVSVDIVLDDPASVDVSVTPGTTGRLLLLPTEASFESGTFPALAAAPGMPRGWLNPASLSSAEVTAIHGPIPRAALPIANVAVGSDGHGRIEGAAPGSYRLCFTGRDQWGNADVVLVPGENRVTIATETMGAIMGQVINAEGAGTEAWVRPIPTDPSHEIYPWSNEDLQTTADGRFFISAAPPGRWRLRAVPLDPAYGRGELETDVLAGEPTQVTIGLGAGRIVTVRARENVTQFDFTAYGAPGARVERVDETTVRVLGLAQDDTGVIVGRSTDPNAAMVGLAFLGVGATEAFLDVGPAATVSGLVIERGGQPAGAGVEVRLVPDYAELPGAAERNPFTPLVDVEGQPEIAQGQPATTGELTVSTDTSGRFGPIRLVPGQVRIEIPGGEAATLHLTFGDRQEVTLRLP